MRQTPLAATALGASAARPAPPFARAWVTGCGRWSRLLEANATLFFVALLAGFLGYRLGEKILLNNGMGWDGHSYGELAKNFSRCLFVEGIPARLADRVLPSAVVYGVLRLLDFPLTDENVRSTFGLVNVALLALSAYVWGRLANSAGLSVRGKWLGLVGLLGGFGVLKLFSYYPVLTDPWALFLGLLALACYAAGRSRALAAVAFAGSFAWPTFLPHALPLLAFPRRPPEEREAPAPRLAAGMAAALTLAICGWAAFVLFAQVQVSLTSLANAKMNYQPVSAAALLALAVVAGYLFVGFRYLLDDARLAPSALARQVRVGPLLLAAAVVLAVKLTVGLYAMPGDRVGFRDALVLSAWTSIRRPGQFLVAHAVYFGPAVVLAMCHWPAVCRVLRAYGPGLVLCAGFNLLLGLDSESRHLIHYLPLLVFAAVKAVDGAALSWGRVLLFAAAAAALSKCWYSIGGLPDVAQWESFPAQRFFMHLGPCMSRKAYLAQGAVVAALAGCALLLAHLERRGPHVVPRAGDQA
jgi:hypothetical protein